MPSKNSPRPDPLFEGFFYPSARARPRIAVEALRQLGVLAADELEPPSKFAHQTLYSHRGEEVVEARAAFHLNVTDS